MSVTVVGLVQWIPDIINLRGTTIGVSYNIIFLYAGLITN